MNFKRLAHMRRRWMCLTEHAKVAASNIGRCTTAENNAYWEDRAERLVYLAAWQMHYMTLEIEKL